ncbi:MAG: PaaI family thioesterase [Alphaproteobacteria bacterium]|nr:PaaI family thioesterase [Alphaproteobacteria bacterium]
MTEDELQQLLEGMLPSADIHGLVVEECGDQDIRLRFPFSPAFIGPGGIFSGPALLSFADTAIFAAAQIGARSGRIAITSNFAVTFLRPAQAVDVLALARVIRKGKRMVHAEAWLFSHAVVDPVLHATASIVLRSA